MSMDRNDRGLVVVAGATGYIGGHVAQALHQSGWRVRGLVRDPARLGAVRDSLDEVFVGEAVDKATLGGVCQDADIVFSSIGIRHARRHPTYVQVDYGANLNLVESAEDAGVHRFIFVSVLDGHIHRRVSPLVEARERVVERLHRSWMTETVLRPTGCFNDMAAYFEMARRGRVWLIGSGDTRLNPIHGADIADLVAGLLAGEAAPEIPLGGPESFTQREVGRLAFEVLGRPSRFGRIPAGLLRGVGMLLQPFNKNAAALASMFAQMGSLHAVGPSVGVRRLEDWFVELRDEKQEVAA